MTVRSTGALAALVLLGGAAYRSVLYPESASLPVALDRTGALLVADDVGDAIRRVAAEPPSGPAECLRWT